MPGFGDYLRRRMAMRPGNEPVDTWDPWAEPNGPGTGGRRGGAGGVPAPMDTHPGGPGEPLGYSPWAQDAGQGFGKGGEYPGMPGAGSPGPLDGIYGGDGAPPLGPWAADPGRYPFRTEAGAFGTASPEMVQEILNRAYRGTTQVPPVRDRMTARRGQTYGP